MNKSAQGHGTDEELLLLLDGELPWRRLARLRGHVDKCAGCRARLARIGTALNDASERQAPPMDASGPRALLRARLAESAHGEDAGSRQGLLAGRDWVRGLAFACALALLAATGSAVFRQETARRAGVYARLLPDPQRTPGATRPVALDQICARDREDVVRSVPAQLQEEVFESYGIANAPAAEFEVDYLIAPGLGGADDVRNLWPEPHANTQWNSYVKDQLEDRLHRMVCEREIPLGEAQREIAGNWIAAYKKYFRTERPLGDLTNLTNSTNSTGSIQSDPALRRKQRGS